jgi:hypothetical protein
MTAVLVYLHISGAGPLLASGFWLIASERFDPRTAKRRFGQITGAGTLGGLFGALVAERVATLSGVPAMLLILAALQFLGAWLVRRLIVEFDASGHSAPMDAAPTPATVRSGLRVVAEAPYLRHLAVLVLLGTTAAALVDYLFKANAVEAFGRGDQLLRFFALYYAATSLVTFVVQLSSSHAVLERFGLALTTSTPSMALLAGSIGALIAPGFGGLLVARGSESVFRGALFRPAYELFYTPIPAAEKRAAKSVIDVAFDRLGDAVGGGLIRFTLLVAPAAQSVPVLLVLAVACSVGAIAAASRLNRGYIGTLANSLINRAGGAAAPEAATKTVRQHFPVPHHGDDGPARSASIDPEVQDIMALRSRDPERIFQVLSNEEGVTPALVPHAIPLLAWDVVADHAIFALRKVAEEHVGQLVDALLDPNQDFAVRRRVARVFSVCVSQRAADGLLHGLDDLRFDVRCQSARSLASILEKNVLVKLPGDRIFAVVLREVTVGRPVWESRVLLDGPDAADARSPLDDFVRDRAGDSLAHVFTLLSLVLEREPLWIAFRSLHTDDAHLQGTALEYLDGVLPAPIRQRLWPYLERGPASRPTRPRDQVIADLLRSNHSIMLNLEELRLRSVASFEPAV